jgi:hypothetical protein
MVFRGDRSRNARLARLRELVPVENAIVAMVARDAHVAAGSGERSRAQRGMTAHLVAVGSADGCPTRLALTQQ